MRTASVAYSRAMASAFLDATACSICRLTALIAASSLATFTRGVVAHASATAAERRWTGLGRIILASRRKVVVSCFFLGGRARALRVVEGVEVVEVGQGTRAFASITSTPSTALITY